MLSKSDYPSDYVATCRSLFDAQLVSYRVLAASAKTSAREAFEPDFCRHLIVVLDAYFVHRARGQEKKDGNPLNEVRMLRDSILEHGSVLTENKSIKYGAEKAVLGLAIGNVIEPSVGDVARLADAFFADVEKKFVQNGG